MHQVLWLTHELVQTHVMHTHAGPLGVSRTATAAVPVVAIGCHSCHVAMEGTKSKGGGMRGDWPHPVQLFNSRHGHDLEQRVRSSPHNCISILDGQPPLRGESTTPRVRRVMFQQSPQQLPTTPLGHAAQHSSSQLLRSGRHVSRESPGRTSD